MNLDDMSRKAGDPRYISGVYNYCDSWCERCAFTERCLNYATRREFEEMAKEAREQRAEDEALAALLDTMEIIEEFDDLPDEEEGMTGPDDWELDEIMVEEARNRQRIKTHPLAQAAGAYIGMANDWFEFGRGQERLASGPRYLIEPESPADDFETPSEDIQDAVAVIRWFLFFISVKIQRALHSLVSEARVPAFWEDTPRDSDGTAKIALIAIDRSTGAWATLMEAYPEKRSATLPILALLTRLRHDLELEFPNAWAFVRPGFDEVDEDQDQLP